MDSLVETGWLAEHQGEPDLRIVDARWYMDPARKGQDAYRAGHIPGAVFVDLDADLSAPGGRRGGLLGRHPWPSEEQVAQVMGRCGIGSGVRVVAYDDQAGAIAARFWYVLRAHGHEAVALLDGGLLKWIAEGRPLDDRVPKIAPMEFKGALQPGFVALREQMVATHREALVFDARAPERYRGDAEPIDVRAGHIPGARNAPYAANLTQGAIPVFRSTDELRRHYESLGAKDREPVVYCGSGVTACHDLLALHRAGLRGRLYPGSWSEWSADPALPVETGGGMRRSFRAALAAGLAAVGCSREAQPPPSAKHLVLVTIDTLRADRLSCYGSRTVTTPHLDAMAAQGALARDASVSAPLTRPSHVTIFTGRYPAEHGIRDNVAPALRAEVPTLAERLKGQGFLTAAFVSSIVLSRQSGLGRGFDTYSDRFEAGPDDARFLNTLQRKGDGPTAEAIAWLESHPSERTFVWLHLYDPHDPYEPPEPYATRYADRPYDGEVAFADDLVGRLDAALERLGRREDTLLVVTSDHGEGLEEHGEAVHGFFVYESTLAVPLLLRGPSIPAGTRLATTVRSVDLAPTVLDLLGVPALPNASGRSLAVALRGGASPADEATYAESLTPLLHFGWSDLRALREGRFKYIAAPRPELFDLKADPGERQNLVATSPAQAEALRMALARRLEAERKTAADPAAAAAIPPELLEQLGALGYVGGGTGGAGTSPGADPKDKLEDYKAVNTLMREGLTRLREKDAAGAVARFEALLARGVTSFEAHYYLARALMLQKRPKAAVGHFEAALARLPAYGAAYTGLADAYVALGEPERALVALRKGQSVSPKDARLFEAEGTIQKALERPREATLAYEAALPLAPKDALLRVKVGEMYRDLREQEKAITLMREAVRLDPEPAAYWNALGMVLGGSQQLADAEAAFREAVKRDPQDAQYAYNLGLALLRQGKKDEAAPFFRRALELEPRFDAARARLAEARGRS